MTQDKINSSLTMSHHFLTNRSRNARVVTDAPLTNKGGVTTKVASVLVLSLAAFAGSVSGQVEPRWVDLGCWLESCSGGCTCNGLSCACNHRAKFSHYGLFHAGEFPLYLEVSVSVHCEVWIFWVLSCSDDKTEDGYGEVEANARHCFITTGASSCDVYEGTHSCDY